MFKVSSSLVLAASLLVSVPYVYAESAAPVAAPAQMQARQNLHHANPMPNYMSVIRKQGDKLNLSAEQKTSLDAWFQANNDKSMAAVKAIVAAEKALADASMQGVAKAELMAKTDEMLQMRRALAEAKVNCRDHVMGVLTPAQWRQVVEMQRVAQK